MAKKVIDIFPPKKKEIIEKKEEQEKKETEIKPKKKRQISLRPLVKRVPVLPFKKGLILFLVFLILSGTFCYITLSKAEISVWPETEAFNLIEQATIDKNATEVDSLLKIIPAETLQKEKTVVQAFPASGKVIKEEKAQGTIKVYNAYSTSAQVLVATTRFVSSDGKVFRTPVKVTVPGGTYEKGKLVPGEADVKVVADQPGKDYNIGPTKFSVPGFAGTDKYTKFYGESFEAMVGGFQEEVAKMTEEDLAQAEEVLVEKAKKECNELLQNELQSEAVSSKFDYLSDTIQTEIVENFSLTSSGTETKDFNYQVKAQCQAVVFKKEDIDNYVKEAIAFQIPQDKKLYEESLKINYNVDSTDLETGQITVSMTILTKIYVDVDIISFKNALKGKTLLEAKLFLENYPKITKASVKFWPFWVNRVPEELSKIKFNLVID
ncbi:MAG: hypothetical protein FJZ05_00790 [Candidatus Nealsonbacteria bacterium]|nr:hypothetical protein [Candidatus Nealsonbacteria bacterium]